LLAIVPLGLLAGGPADHFTDSRELYGLVEGDEWAHVEALDPDAGYAWRSTARTIASRARGPRRTVHMSPCSWRKVALRRWRCGLVSLVGAGVAGGSGVGEVDAVAVAFDGPDGDLVGPQMCGVGCSHPLASSARRHAA
jgi:hypothetical protein